ncbi:hypothetical protein KUTeg_008475 [Tegillarca granosa]|uniref:Uncharacterized protein n=1 Tax=Tegillarca granosa TaxID=220873 RepID=A0ABQ9F984_TEGGR|nr:hypothetical protein KUTeg_008475 [Tegillarca granosa]
MDTIVNPLRSSVKTVGRVVSHGSDGIAENFGKVFGTDSLDDNRRTEDGKVGAALSVEVGDNIPLRIMLLLMDELFDLRLKNQWFRRRMTVILRQLIKATFGDTINRLIYNK